MSECATDGPIVFFDGVCGLCNHFVDVLLRLDRDGVLRFASLQGETAKRLLPPLADDSSEWTVVYLDEHGTRYRSDAVLAIAARLGGWLRILSWLRVLPRSLRDWLYRLVARHRYRLFGKRDAARVPTQEERARFLE